MGKKKDGAAPVAAPIIQKNEKLKALAVEIFEVYPAAAEVYFTADSVAFLRIDHTQAHAKQIGNNEIITIKCEEV